MKRGHTDMRGLQECGACSEEELASNTSKVDGTMPQMNAN